MFLVMFESTKMQTKLRTIEFEPKENISFSIGTIFLVNKLYEVLNFRDIFEKHKTRGINLNNLLRALISYKLTDNFSIKRAHNWISRPEVLVEFSLPPSAKEHCIVSLKSLAVIGKKSSLTSRISFF